MKKWIKYKCGKKKKLIVNFCRHCVEGSCCPQLWNRIAPKWNNLSDKIISAKSLNSFKARLVSTLLPPADQLSVPCRNPILSSSPTTKISHSPINHLRLNDRPWHSRRVLVPRTTSHHSDPSFFGLLSGCFPVVT